MTSSSRPSSRLSRLAMVGVMLPLLAVAMQTTVDPPLAPKVDAQTVADRDWGDAPPVYPTTFGQNGARHIVNGQDPLRMGATVDVEANGQPSALATADGNPDEDGVLIPPLFPGATAIATIEQAGGLGWGNVSAWIDFNADGDWTDAGEQVLTNVFVSGTTAVPIAVPPGATIGTTFARFRLSEAGNLAITGEAPVGEVEDYAVRICETEPPPNCCTDVMLVVDTSNSMSGTNIAQAVASATATATGSWPPAARGCWLP